jgi:hypothetical protein
MEETDFALEAIGGGDDHEVVENIELMRGRRVRMAQDS